MGENLVIVALPEADDLVWKISSEKKPHLTMLFLGETAKVANLEGIVQFVQHAVNVSEHGPFWLDVDRRDVLGDDQADVLHFRKDYSYKWVNWFRNQLLQNQAIRAAYDSTEQFPEWLPHLTLGYPEAPAKPHPQDSGRLYSVAFDRIAVWTGDFEGPEFRLEWPERDEEVRMSDISQAGETAVAELLHYGVKGMRWGVRKSPASEPYQGMFDPSGHSKSSDIFKAVVWPLVPPLGLFSIPADVRLVRGAARGVKSKAIDVNEKRFAAKAQTADNFSKIHKGAGPRVDREIESLNSKYPGDLTKDPKRQKAYDDEVVKALQNSYRESANSMGNRFKTTHLDLEFKNDGLDFTIQAKQGAPTPIPSRLKHAVEDDDPGELTITGRVLRDDTGHFRGLDFDLPGDASMAQTADLGAEFLLHYGVKGMRWGVRRENPLRGHIEQARSREEAGRRAMRSPSEVQVTDSIGASHRSKTKLRAKGGEDHPATEDAIKVAEAQQKLKKSGVHALSNKELQEMERRMNLEQNVARLMGNKKSFAGKKFVDQHLTNNPKNQRKLFENVTSSRRFRRAAATAATTAALA